MMISLSKAISDKAADQLVAEGEEIDVWWCREGMGWDGE